MLTILGLRQSVGIEEQRTVGSNLRFLEGILIVFENANGQIRYYFKSVIIDEWCIVTGITIAQTSCRQVEHANEQGDKHIRTVALAGGLVNCLHDTRRVIFVGRGHTEQRVYDSHHQC